MNDLPMINIDSLAKVEQLPVIAEQLKEVKALVEAKVQELVLLECNEDTVKDVKKSRAELNKVLTAFEDKRKEIKAAVTNPYTAFEKVYKECVSDPLKMADGALKGKIDAVETELKGEKEKAVKAFYDEYATAVGVDFVPFEKSGIEINLSTSEKKYKETAKAFLDKIAEEVTTIGTLPDAAEIMAEYKVSLNMANAMTTVANRKKAVEEEKARATERATREAEIKAREDEVNNKAQGILSPLAAPTQTATEDDKTAEPTYTAKFSVTATLEELKALKNYMNERGIKYANIE